MPHEFESGMFVQKPAWHQLGNVLPDAPDSLGALEASGLNWNVQVMPMFANSPSEEWLATPYNGIIRDKDNVVLGVCKGRWTPYQNQDAFEWCLPLVEDGKFHYESAGSLKGGEVCWILLKNRTEEIVPNDYVDQYLLVTWAHNGKSANIVQPTSIRVVCNNTLTQALREDVNRVAVNHSQFVKLNMETVKEIFGIATRSFDSQLEIFRTLASKQISKEKRGYILDQIFPVSDEMEGKALTIAKRNREMVDSLVDSGSGIQENGLEGTAFALYQGVSEAVEHYLGGNRIKDRGNNILFGRGRDVVDKAFELVVSS